MRVHMRDDTTGRPFDGIIFDLTVVGGMCGKDAAREIRALDEKVPIIIASGYSEDVVMANPRDFGFNDSISKPYTKAELATVLRRPISKSS
jgi:two-component system, cell cycle sensor histidine kinase and response regulator CckA